MDADDSSLHSITQRLQTLRLKDVPDENVGTLVSYLKGALMLLQNCSDLPIDTVGLIMKSCVVQTVMTLVHT